jgi:NADH-quinone oxidoreductase subunit G
VGATQPWDSLAALRRALVAAHPHLSAIDTVPANAWQPEPAGALGAADFRLAIRDFYLTNPIARSSQLMAKLSALAASRGLKVAAE